MKFHPLTVTEELIPAILNGTKGVTRRALMPPPFKRNVTIGEEFEFPTKSHGITIVSSRKNGPTGWLEEWGKYHPGDVLWVKETYFSYGFWGDAEGEYTSTGRQKTIFCHMGNPVGPSLYYSNDMPDHITVRSKGCASGFYKRLARFMPKKYCRTFLEIEDVRIERVQDITEDDARLEGAGKSVMPYFITNNPKCEPAFPTQLTHLGGFITLWEKLHGPDAWYHNGWVYRLKFKKISKPLDFLTH